MLSPSPFSLLCALLLCLPLAIVFTITTPSTPCSTTATAATSSTNTSTLRIRPLSALYLPAGKTLQKPHNSNATLLSSTSIFPVPPPPLLDHNETYDDAEDNSLFHLAGLVNPNPEPPFKKLAFMFLTTTPLPFAPLWELFFNQAPRNLYNIYIHADPNISYSPPFRGVFARRVIPSKPTRRYSPTLTAATRRLLSRALLHDKSNYMFALLSPSCIPLHSFNFTHRFLMKSNRSFVEILNDEAGAYGRWAARGEDAMLPEVKFEDFRIGSQFFVLKRKHARIVMRDSRLWSKFKLPCLRLNTCYPEEHYFATLLRMADPHGCVPASLTNVDWRGGHGGHPRMYKGDEVNPELIQALRKRKPRYGTEGSNGSDLFVTTRHDPFLFARKFSAQSIQPLMAMAKDVLFKD